MSSTIRVSQSRSPLPAHGEGVGGEEAPSLLRRLTSVDGIDVLVAILLWKLGTFATAYIAWALLPFNQDLYTANYRYGDRVPASFADSFNTWDSQHYLRLADRGYQEGLITNAFGPLYPLLIRVTGWLTGDSIVAGLLIANVASGAALYLLYRLVCKRWDREVAFATVLLCMAFPTAFFLNLIYTEALFLLLTVVLFYALYERRWWIAAAAGFLLPILRVPGLVALVPTAWFLARDALGPGSDALPPPRRVPASASPEALEGRVNPRRPGAIPADALATETKRTGSPSPRRERGLGGEVTFRWSNHLLFVLAPVAGLLLYLLYMHIEVGNAFVAMDAEKSFISERSLGNVLRPDRLLADFFRSSYSVHDYLDSAIDRVFFVVFVASLPVVYRRVDTPMFLFCAIIGLQPFLGSFMSYTRLVMVAFPLYIAWAATFTSWRPALTYAVAYPMLLLQSVFLALQVNSNWVA